MNSKLEERLYLYERDHPIHSDQDLLTALEAILDEQDSLPINRRDFDLVSEATDFVLYLNGYSDEQLTEMANEVGEIIRNRIQTKEIPEKRKVRPRSHLSRLAWIILVAIVGTITITSVSAAISGINILTATKQFIINLVSRDSVSLGNQDFYTTNNFKSYDSIDDLSNDYRNVGVLLPELGPDEIMYSEIDSTLYDNVTSIRIIATLLTTGKNATIVIILNDEDMDSVLPNSVLCGRDVFLTDYNGSNQCEFQDDYGNHYIIQGQSFDTIKTILNSMEAKK
jgi:hypothetical protein